MALFNNFPYTDLNSINLDYTLNKLNDLYTQGQTLYSQLTAWKDQTDADLEAFRTGLLADVAQWESDLNAALATWKDGVDADVVQQLNAAKAELLAYSQTVLAGAEAAQTAAEAAQTAAETAETNAETARTAAEAAATSVTASAAQIATNTADITDLKSALNNLSDSVSDISFSKNLYNKDDPNVLVGYIQGGDDPTIGVSTRTKTVYVKCKPNTTYTVSKVISTRFIVAYCSEIPYVGLAVSGVVSDATNSALTLTTGADAEYLLAFVYNESTDSLTFEEISATIQIEEGTTATGYTEYDLTAVDKIARETNAVLQSDVDFIKTKLPSAKEIVTPTNYAGMYIGSSRKIVASPSLYLSVVEMQNGETLTFASESYSTAGGYPAICKDTSAVPVVDEYADVVLLNGSSTNQNVEYTYTATEHCYIYVVQHPDDDSRGQITILRDVTAKSASEEVLNGFMYPLADKKIAVLGDSIMQYMSGGFGGANVQTFEENGNSHTYDEITITDGIPYYNGNECTVVNSKQSYYEAQGWQALKDATKASMILNCSIGGSVIHEGTISTPYPGYEDGTHYTNSLPNLVKWLFRECENTTDPDIAIIWMGTNGLGTNSGSISEAFSASWSLLDSNAGHTLRQTTYGALRYAIEKIYRDMPHTYILVLGPIPANPSGLRTFENLKNRSDLMKSVCDRVAIKFIEPLTQIEINPMDEADEHRYLTDGVHCTDIGKKLLTDYLVNKIRENYQYKY